MPKDYQALLLTYLEENRMKKTFERTLVLDLAMAFGKSFTYTELVKKAESQRISEKTVRLCLKIYGNAGIMTMPVKQYSLKQAG